MITAESSEFIAVGETVGSTASCTPGTGVPALADEFFKQPALDSVAVVESQRPLGLITRQKFLFTVFRRFGWEVYGRKAVDQLTDRNALVVPARTRLDEALALAERRRRRARPRARESERAEVAVPCERHARAALAGERHHRARGAGADVGRERLRGPGARPLSLLLSSATNLRSIITNILDLSKIEAGRMQVIDEEFDLTPLLREIVETTRVMITDPVKVRQIVLNLTSNAAKFTDQGRIRVEQSYSEHAAVIRVADTGIGIRREDQQRLFEAFSQLEDAKSKRHGGTGLGLAITREMLELVGGAIALESAFGAGTVFTVSIPNRKGAAS